MVAPSACNTIAGNISKQQNQERVEYVVEKSKIFLSKVERILLSRKLRIHILSNKALQSVKRLSQKH
jgi:nucleoside permease NupC